VEGKYKTYTSSIVFLISLTEGREALSFVNASSNEAGRVTFWRASKLGTLICGAEILPKGLTLLTASMADLMTLFADAMSFWIPVRKLLVAAERRLLTYHEFSGRLEEDKQFAHLLNCSNKNGKTTSNNKLQKAEKSGSVEINNKVDDCLPDGQGEDEGGTSGIHGSINCICVLLVRGKGHITRHARGRCSSIFCGLAAREELFLCARDCILSAGQRKLKTEGDKDEGKNGIREPCEREEMGELQIGRKGRGRRVSVVSWRRNVPGRYRHDTKEVDLRRRGEV